MTTTKRSDPAAILEKLRADPVLFSEQILNFKPWSAQRDILRAFAEHPRVAVASSHGIGKSTVAAAAALYFMALWKNSRVIILCPTHAQVRHQTFAEINRFVENAPRGFFPECDVTQLIASPSWYTLGMSPRDSGRLAGHHSRSGLAYIIDEAAAIDEELFPVIFSALTGTNSKILMLGNPVSVSGTFRNAFYSDAPNWHRMKISAYDTPNMTGEDVGPEVAAAMIQPAWIEEQRARFGEDSPVFQTRVLGEFADEATPDAVFPLSEIEAAMNRDVEPGDNIVIGVDPARFGDDSSVIAVARGDVVTIEHRVNGASTMELVGMLMDTARRLGPYKSLEIRIDSAGIGSGVFDRARELNLPVVEFVAAGKAHEPDEYINRRSESYFELKDRLPALQLPKDDELLAELVSARYQFTSRGQRQVIAKDKMKSEIGRSPDTADAVIYATCARPRTGASFNAGGGLYD